MKNLLKLSLILFVALTFFMNTPVLATETNNSQNTQTTSSQQTSNNNSSTQVTSVASVNDGELSFSDILNILLIATGIVIILLAIAIFIRLK